MAHTSVLLQEVIGSLEPRQGGVFVDATFGAGGHSRSIATLIGRTGTLISLDADEGVFVGAHIDELDQLTKFIPCTANFRTVGKALEERGVEYIDGALFDLGLSSTQLEESGRGFTFQRDEPLQMTFAKHAKEGDVTAESVVNLWGEDSIAAILKGFGDERFARSIARGIVETRKTGKIVSTGQLAEVIRQSTPAWYHRGRTHFATRTFQAIRMAVNDELGAIEEGVSGVLPFIRPNGRLAVITFHSIEDRLVKQKFRALKESGIVSIVNKKPVVPSAGEVRENPRSRSAKLRVVEKL